TCGELRAAHIGQEASLCGWVDSYRDHGGAIFIDLRDRYGLTQIMVGPESGATALEFAQKLRLEDVVRVTGQIAHRPAGTTNPKLATGETELRAAKLELLNRGNNPPFTPSQQDPPGEDMRLKYRLLDLRRQEMQNTLLLRSRIIKGMR